MDYTTRAGGTSTSRGLKTHCRKCVVCICYVICVSGGSLICHLQLKIYFSINETLYVCTIHITRFHCSLLIYRILGVPQNYFVLSINTHTHKQKKSYTHTHIHTHKKNSYTLLLHCSILATKCWRTCMWLQMFLVCLVWSPHVFLQLV